MSCMNKETISAKQAVSMLIVFLIGSATLFIMGLEAKMDIWLAILVAIAASTLILGMYARILSILPESDFFQTLEKLLGRPVTIIMVLLLTWFSFDLGNIVLTNYGQFVYTVGLTETPKEVIYLSMILVCGIAVKSGLEALGRWSKIFVVLIIGFLMMMIAVLTTRADINNLKPILNEGIAPVFKGALGVISFPLAETVVFLLVLPAFKKGVSKYKIYMKSLYVVGGLILVISTLEVMLFGAAFAETVAYPSYLALSIADVGIKINRLEPIAAAVFTFAVFFKISILLLAACKGIAYVFKLKNYRTLVFPIALMMVNFTFFSFSSVIGFQEWTFKVFPYYSCIFEIVIPFVIFILIEIRYRIIKKGAVE